MAGNELSVVIKKVKKVAGHGHHGGAWKVAYADFVTAMMAFFLLLWLLNATTEEQKRGIADYFTPSTASDSRSGAGSVLGGQTLASPGAALSRSAVPSISVDIKPTTGAADAEGEEDSGPGGENQTQARPPTEGDLEKALAKKEEERFKKAEAELKQAIEQTPELKDLAKNLIVDRTPEGLRIQVVDQEGQPMFPLGSAEMLDRTKLLMKKIAQVIEKLPNRISISGHTDAQPFRGAKAGHRNWELSSDRALASRRELINGGFKSDRVLKVEGKAETDPLLKDDPKSPRNRRISIVLLREANEAAKEAVAATGGAKTPQSAEVPSTPKPPGFNRDWSGPRLR
jgi:chemotaxis protein MotB